MKDWMVVAILVGAYLWWRSKKGPIVYTCPYCGMEFSTQEALDAHIASEHPGEPPPPAPPPGDLVAPAIYGWVTDSLTGQPISGVKVTVNRIATTLTWETYTNTSGYYALEVQGPQFRADFRKTGYATQSVSFPLRGDQIKEVSIALEVFVPPPWACNVLSFDFSIAWKPPYTDWAGRLVYEIVTASFVLKVQNTCEVPYWANWTTEVVRLVDGAVVSGAGTISSRVKQGAIQPGEVVVSKQSRKGGAVFGGPATHVRLAIWGAVGAEIVYLHRADYPIGGAG